MLSGRAKWWRKVEMNGNTGSEKTGSVKSPFFVFGGGPAQLAVHIVMIDSWLGTSHYVVRGRGE
jgi:hypothetical protein